MENELLGTAGEILGFAVMETVCARGTPAQTKAATPYRRGGARLSCAGARKLGAELRTEVEFQQGSCFCAGRCILPALQRFFDGIHQQRMTADHFG